MYGRVVKAYLCPRCLKLLIRLWVAETKLQWNQTQSRNNTLFISLCQQYEANITQNAKDIAVMIIWLLQSDWCHQHSNSINSCNEFARPVFWVVLIINIGDTQPVKLTFLNNGLYLCQLTDNYQFFMVN